MSSIQDTRHRREQRLGDDDHEPRGDAGGRPLPRSRTRSRRRTAPASSSASRRTSRAARSADGRPSRRLREYARTPAMSSPVPKGERETRVARACARRPTSHTWRGCGSRAGRRSSPSRSSAWRSPRPRSPRRSEAGSSSRIATSATASRACPPPSGACEATHLGVIPGDTSYAAVDAAARGAVRSLDGRGAGARRQVQGAAARRPAGAARRRRRPRQHRRRRKRPPPRRLHGGPLRADQARLRRRRGDSARSRSSGRDGCAARIRSTSFVEAGTSTVGDTTADDKAGGDPAGRRPARALAAPRARLPLQNFCLDRPARPRRRAGLACRRVRPRPRPRAELAALGERQLRAAGAARPSCSRRGMRGASPTGGCGSSAARRQGCCSRSPSSSPRRCAVASRPLGSG